MAVQQHAQHRGHPLWRWAPLKACLAPHFFMACHCIHMTPVALLAWAYTYIICYVTAKRKGDIRIAAKDCWATCVPKTVGALGGW